MSEQDPTRQYPPPEACDTAVDLRQMIREVVTEVVKEQLAPVIEQVTSLQAQANRIETELTELRKEVRRQNHKMEALHDTFLDFKTDLREFHERITDLEKAGV